MSRSVSKSDAALEDLANIWEFIALDNPVSGDPEAADRVVDAIDTTIEGLSDFPFHRQVSPKGLHLVPTESFSKYLILYRFDDIEVEVLRVFRSDLDWTRLI